MTELPGLRTALAWPAALMSAGAAATSTLAAAPRQAGSGLVRQAGKWADQLIPAIMESVVSRVDLTDLVIRHVDLDRVVATVDLDAAVRRVDLLGLAQYIIDGVDLPSIVRSSSASLTTEAVHRIREHGVDADTAVSRVVDRLIPRRHNGHRPVPDVSADSLT